MKKILNCLLIGAVVIGASSCKKYLDVNTNPNDATQASASLVLPQALTVSASMTTTFSANMADAGGFQANVAGFGGYGSVITTAYNTSNFTGMWTGTYDNVNDYRYIIEQNAGDATLVYTTSIARIMKAFAFGRLVDQYNDVPYTEALQGATKLSPKYDKAEDVYKDLVKELNESITAIAAGEAAGAATTKVPAAIDPLFKGDMNKWKRFANSVKLRLLVKLAGVPSTAAFATTEFAALNASTVGFLQDDALNQPGYIREAGRTSPIFNNLAFSSNDVRVNTSRTATKWIVSFVDGNKILDAERGKLMFRGYPSVAANQLGDETSASVAAPNPTAWYTGPGTTATSVVGTAKFHTQGQPVMLLAEVHLNLAEAQSKGFMTAADQGLAAFENGVKASFNYLYKNGADAPTKTAAEIQTMFNAYKTANAGNWLVNYNIAVGGLDYNTNPAARRQEAISTQKYIALANIMNDEAFNEYKRTGWPRVIPGGTAVQTPASKVSVATTADKLISRVLYPQEEYNLNAANAPQGISLYTSKIFWDVN